MSDTKIAGPVGRFFGHMRDNPLIWAAGFGVVALICGAIRYSQGVQSAWGDVMAFSGMLCGIMIILYGEQHRRPELRNGATTEGSNV